MHGCRRICMLMHDIVQIPSGLQVTAAASKLHGCHSRWHNSTPAPGVLMPRRPHPATQHSHAPTAHTTCLQSLPWNINRTAAAAHSLDLPMQQATALCQDSLSSDWRHSHWEITRVACQFALAMHMLDKMASPCGILLHKPPGTSPHSSWWPTSQPAPHTQPLHDTLNAHRRSWHTRTTQRPQRRQSRTLCARQD